MADDNQAQIEKKEEAGATEKKQGIIKEEKDEDVKVDTKTLI